MNTIKDVYLKAIDWIDNNPQKALWYALAVCLVLLVF